MLHFRNNNPATQTEPENSIPGWKTPTLTAIACTVVASDAIKDANLYQDYKFYYALTTLGPH